MLLEVTALLYKNWSAICLYPDVHLRLAVALSTDEEFLRKISLGFPELFTEQEPERVGPFPLSYLKEVVTRNMETPRDYSNGHGELVTEVGLPHTCMGHAGDAELSFPPNFYRDEFPKLLKVSEEHGYFPFHLHEVVVEGTRYFMGVPMEDYEDVVLFPADLIDVNA